MSRSIRKHYKYNKLISLLRKKIFDGEFDSDGKLPTERELVRLLGYSRITIRTALQELREDGLIEQRRGVGTYLTSWKKQHACTALYLPAVSTSDKPLRFGFIASHPHVAAVEDDPYLNLLMLGFLRSRGPGRNFTIETATVKDMQQRGVFEELCAEHVDIRKWDGMIIAIPLSEKDLHFLEHCPVPFVLQGEPESEVSFPVVTSDNYRGACDAARHLLDTGRRMPVLVYGNESNLWMRRRLSGFQRPLLDLGIRLPEKNFLTLESVSQEAAAARFSERLKLGFDFDSVVTFGDWPTVGVLNVLHKNAVRIPEDIALINFDSYTWLFRSANPPLTCVSQPFSRIGELCIEMLYERLEHPDGDIHMRIVRPQLTIRESTAQTAMKKRAGELP